MKVLNISQDIRGASFSRLFIVAGLTIAFMLLTLNALADEGLPDQAYGAINSTYRPSDSPLLRLPEDMRTWPSIVPPEPREVGEMEDPTAVEIFNVATREVIRLPSSDPTQQPVGPNSNLKPPYQGLLPPGIVPESVFPPDDRARITPTTTYPWRTVCKLFSTFPDGARGGCSGAIIGCPDGHGYHVLTAGHCVYSHDHGGWATSVQVVPGLDHDYMPYNYAWATLLRSYTGWTVYADHQHDWALVTIDRNVGDFTGWMGRMTAPASDPVYIGILNTAGYPCNVYDPNNCPYPVTPANTMWWDADNGRTANEYNHWYYMDTQPGQSGSPVWVYYTDPPSRYILTIHAYGDDGSSSNHGTRLNNDKFDRIITWCNSDTPPTDYADLIDDGQTLSGFTPTTVIRGQTNFQAWCDVRNIGTASSGGFDVSYYASTNTTITPSDYLIGTDYVSSISPFNYGDSDWSGTFPSSVPAGEYWVGWIIDSGSDVTEFDENNNTAYKNSYKLTVVDPCQIIVTSPNGGENWRVGESHNISWTSQGTSGNVKIDYSTNGGSSWQTVVSSTADDGSYLWTMPNTPSSDCLVKICDAKDPDCCDQSDETFTISEPCQITVIWPNGGEIWCTGENHYVRWTSQGTSDEVCIQYSTDGGGRWTDIACCTHDDGWHAWKIPDTPSNTCLVRIQDCIDLKCYDISDKLFSINVGPCKRDILFDISHGFAGGLHVDFLNGLVDALEADGHIVTTTQANFDLTGYNAVYLFGPGSDYTADELAALQNFVAGGGLLAISGEHSGGFGVSNLNHVCSMFGMTIEANVVYDDTDNDQGINYWPLITSFEDAHPTVAGPGPPDTAVSINGYYAGASLTVDPGVMVIATTDGDGYIVYPKETGSDGASASGGPDLSSGVKPKDIVPGEPIVMAATSYGSGCVFVVGDWNIWADDKDGSNIGIEYYDNRQLALNVFNWTCEIRTVTVTWCGYDPPTCLSGQTGTRDTVFVCVDDLTEEDVISYQASITFDPAVLAYVGCSSTGTISESWGPPFCAEPTPGEVNVGGFGTAALSGSGPLVGLIFDVVGDPGDVTDLCFQSMLFNAGNPGAETPVPCCCYEIPKVGDIAGTVTYCPTGGPVENVIMTLSGGSSGTVTTDNSGHYEFLNLPFGLNYTVTPSRPDETCPYYPHIIMYDAALVAQYVVGMIPLTPCQQKAADVDENGFIQMFDAALIAQCAVGLPNPLSHAGEWRFDPASRSYTPLGSDQMNEHYIATLLGDVDGNWMPAAAGPLKQPATGSYKRLPDMEAGVVELIQVPLVMEQANEVISADIVFGYDPQVLEFVGISKTLLSEALQLVYNDSEPGKLRAGLYGTTPITQPGELVVLAFKVIGKEGQTTLLSLERYQLNAGVVKSAEAKLTVVTQIPNEYSLSQNYPNPFNPETNIGYQLPVEGWVTLKVYNIEGQLVRTLVNGNRETGRYEVNWNGCDSFAEPVSSGIYFYRLHAGGFTQTRRMILIK